MKKLWNIMIFANYVIAAMVTVSIAVRHSDETMWSIIYLAIAVVMAMAATIKADEMWGRK